jgi:hypothetical protein
LVSLLFLKALLRCMRVKNTGARRRRKERRKPQVESWPTAGSSPPTASLTESRAGATIFLYTPPLPTETS